MVTANSIALFPLRELPKLSVQVANDTSSFLLLLGRGFGIFQGSDYFFFLFGHLNILALPLFGQEWLLAIKSALGRQIPTGPSSEHN